MRIEHVEVLVEEPSAGEAMRVLLPWILGKTSFQVYPHLCKEELLQRLPQRLKGYASWLPSNWRVVVVVDRDEQRCDVLKRRLEAIARDVGLATRSSSTNGRFSVVNRIAVEELEAWYFGDWLAVRRAYPRVPPNIMAQTKYRLPDAIRGGTWEAFERILQDAGYFKTGLRKIEAARAVAECMNPALNVSPSFVALRDALAEMMR